MVEFSQRITSNGWPGAEKYWMLAVCGIKIFLFSVDFLCIFVYNKPVEELQ